MKRNCSFSACCDRSQVVSPLHPTREVCPSARSLIAGQVGSLGTACWPLRLRCLDHTVRKRTVKSATGRLGAETFPGD